MRIKFLSVIVSFLIVSFALSSCLDSDDNYEFSSDATIHAFGIDTIHGKHYKFTIDQLNRLIYNRDSLPVGSDTIIDRILIDTMTVTGWITSGSPTDTVFVMSDSVDLRPAMNNDAGMLFKAHAADGVTVREYKLKVNVHLQGPDSLVWTDMQKRGNIFSNTINLGQQKAVVLGDELFVYTSNSTAYKTSTAPDKYNWSKVNVSNLPSDVKLTSAVEYNNALYMVTESKRVFSSTNGGAWTEVTTLGDNVIVLINGFSDRLSGIVEINGKQYFNICKDGKNWEGTVKGTFSNLTSAQTITLETPVTARYFKFIPLSEMHGRKWASAAELNVSILKNISGASQRQIVVSVDSDADNSMKLAADGNINTYWHTVHNQFYIAPYPHEIHLSLSKEATIKGIRYTPRQDSEEGRIASYEVYASKDGKNWGQPIIYGTFHIGTATQTIEFTPCRARYVKLLGLSAHDKGKKAAIAELEIILEE